MTYDPTRHHRPFGRAQGRRSIRLKGYDYASPGAYFVTICVRGGECLLGEVVDGEMQLNERGRVVGYYWGRMPRHFPHVELDAWVVMPNHVHGIIVITDRPPATNRRAIGVAGRHRREFQIGDDPAHQPHAQDARSARLATQLLGTYRA
jgi:REP element-mobilizing transposase RayT